MLGVSDFFNLFTGRGTRITEGSNLNDIIKPGAYYIQNHEDATTISNKPNSMAAVVFVICAFTASSSWSYGGVQLHISHYGLYGRVNNGGTWSSWQNLVVKP